MYLQSFRNTLTPTLQKGRSANTTVGVTRTWLFRNASGSDFMLMPGIVPKHANSLPTPAAGTCIDQSSGAEWAQVPASVIETLLAHLSKGRVAIRH